MPAQITHIAVLVSAVAYFLIGGIWYTVFAKPWMKAVGKTEEEIKQRASAVPYVGSFVGGLTAALVLALLIDYTGANTALAGIRVAFLGCVGFAVGATFGDYLFVDSVSLRATQAGIRLASRAGYILTLCASYDPASSASAWPSRRPWSAC